MDESWVDRNCMIATMRTITIQGCILVSSSVYNLMHSRNIQFAVVHART